MFSSMWHVTCVLVYIVTVVEPSLKTRSINLIGKNELDLGSYDAKVEIGKLPSPYNLTKEDERLADNAAKTLELLRSFFPTGILSIPPLDPYKSKKVNIFTITAADTPLLTGKIEILQVLLQGAKSFNLKSLQIRLKDTLRADFDVEIPSLRGHVLFHADLRLGGILPISVKGKLKFKIKEISVKGAVGAEETAHEDVHVYQLKNLHANIHADEVYVTLKGIGTSVIQDISRIVKIANFQNAPLIESTNKIINNYVAKRVIEELNKILKGFSVNQIKSFLQNTNNL